MKIGKGICFVLLSYISVFLVICLFIYIFYCFTSYCDFYHSACSLSHSFPFSLTLSFSLPPSPSIPYFSTVCLLYRVPTILFGKSDTTHSLFVDYPQHYALHQPPSNPFASFFPSLSTSSSSYSTTSPSSSSISSSPSSLSSSSPVLASWYLRHYYMIQLSYHFHSLIWQLTQRSRNDLAEMVLHHICAVFLVGFSYCANFTRSG